MRRTKLSSRRQSLITLILICYSLSINTVSAQLSKNQDKFLGNITTWSQVDYGSEAYYTLWNQITPENESKWGSVEGSKGYYNFSGANNAFNYANNHDFTYKFHALVWGAQYPNWFNSDMSVNERYNAIVKWFDAVKRQYNTLPLIDVVNEAVGMHQQGNPLMKESLGGGGITGYDWLIKAFELAYERWPDAILIYNDYNTFQFDTDAYIDLVRTLRDAGAPIDAYGCQSHELKGFSKSSLTDVDTKIQNALKMPMYVTEYDIQTEDDDAQLADFKNHIPYFWENDYCAGITLWGYIYGKTWNEGTSGIINYNENTKKNTDRKAMTWLREYMASDKAKNAKSPFPGMKKQISLYIKPESIKATRNDTLPITVRARMVNQNIKIDSIELYVKGKLFEKMTKAPYVAKYVPTVNGRHDLKAIVYTSDGKTYEREGGFTAYNPRSVYKSMNLPGTVQAEDFDKGGDGVTYHDSNSNKEGDASSYRSDCEGVDIVNGNSGKAIGYTNTDEWLEYTVNVTKAGFYSYQAVVSSGTTGSGFRLSLSDSDGLTNLTENIVVPKTADNNWNTYTTLSGRTLIQLKEGQQIIRLTITGSSCNIDKIIFNHVEVDKTLNLKISAAPSPATVNQKTTLTFTPVNSSRYDALSTVKVFANGTLIKTINGKPFNCTYTPTAKGTVTISSIAIDTLGHESEITKMSLTVNNQRYAYKTIDIPGILQAEDFDKGGEGLTFHDSDSDDEGKASYRSDNEGVDIVAENNGYAIGYTRENGEWLEYTLNVKTGGKYAIKATVCSGLDNSGFRIGLMNNGKEDQLANVSVSNKGWNNYYVTNEINLSKDITEGQHTFRITITGVFCNIDKIEFICTEEDAVYYIFKDDETVGARYNLGGTLVGDDYKGISIINGKKVLR